MHYKQVYLESIGYTLPEEVVSSSELEARLAPAYERLRLPPGRLELMTGIAERRFFPAGTQPGDVSVVSGLRALAAAQFDPAHIGALVHGSVCRDHLEPATACSVHHRLGLPPDCVVYDVSNACLGILTGMVQVANQIELGQIRAGLVLGAELGRDLVENTVARLNADTSITRKSVKQLVASLTIGSASAAVLLCHRDISTTGNRLWGGAAVAHTSGHQLCQSEGMTPFMETDSEQLMQLGVATGAETFDKLLVELNWRRKDIDRTICHQVGSAHRKLLLETLALDPQSDYVTYDRLGNTGAAALPVALALAAEEGFLAPGQRTGLLGIGSGVNCQMLGLEWQRTRVAGGYGSDFLR